VPRWSPRVLFPGYSDALAYELGLLDTSVPLEELRVRHDVSDRIRSFDPAAGVPFGTWIRQDLITVP
jgi:hypothetical protein